MNEPKRRGRPPKAKVEEMLVGGADESIYQPIAPSPLPPDTVALPRNLPSPPGPEFDGIRAQAYALRVWNGQSPDVPRSERLRRVAKALEGQVLSMEGVELP